MRLEAITFDLWDTVIHDDSDEPVRAQMGLRTKTEERIHRIWKALQEHADVPIEQVCLAYRKVNDEFNYAWHEEFITWTVMDRLTRILSDLGHGLPSAEQEALVDSLEYMEIEIPPKPVDGIHEALEAVSSQFPLAVVSDAIFTPGRYLRTWLEQHELAHHFSGFAFSDEVGRSKPHPDIFNSAASQLGTDLVHMAHIGDREHNDIKGAHALGMKGILFAGTRAADRQMTSADGVFTNYTELPDILNRISSS